jgi:antitoxin (DNA-binding transcriptional repressor) of toxin-antitoxin stability system
VVDRAAHGETITVTRAGKPVAELRAVPPRAISAESLLSHWQRLPAIDPEALRSDIDDLLDSGL